MGDDKSAGAKPRDDWQNSTGAKVGLFRASGEAEAKVRFFEWDDGSYSYEVTVDGSLLADGELHGTDWKAFAAALREA